MSEKEKNESMISVFVKLWKIILADFVEYSFNISELEIQVEADEKLTKLIFSKKLQREFLTTFNEQKKEINISQKNEVFAFLNDGSMHIKEGPSISLAMMQILIIHTRNRLKEEKREKIKRNKDIIRSAVNEVLKKNNFSLQEIEDQQKVRIWFKNGVYYIKISYNKKRRKEDDIRMYLFYDELMENLRALSVESIEVSYIIK